MKYQIIGKNIEVTEGISAALTKKLSKMDKYFKDNDEVSCRAVVRSYKKGEAKVEITIFTRDTTFRAEVKTNDLYAAFDLAIDKLQGQMRKLKTKLRRRYDHDGIGKAIAFEEIQDEVVQEEESKVVRTKTLTLKPISVEEAVIEMESIGHDFYLYLDTDDEKISVVYKREDGGYGLLQADNKVNF